MLYDDWVYHDEIYLIYLTFYPTISSTSQEPAPFHTIQLFCLNQSLNDQLRTLARLRYLHQSPGLELLLPLC